VRTGRGRYVDVAMTDASLAHNIFALHALEQWGHVLPRGEDLLTGGFPCYGVYPTRDGRWLAVGALEEKFWRALCAAIGRPDLVAGQFADGDEGVRVRRELERVFSEATLVEWTARLAQVDCCVTPVATLDEALDDAQFAERRMVRERGDGSREYAPPFKVSGHEFRVTREAPAQGQHGPEILREAGYGDEAIAALVAAGVVRTS
jgi:crotonobetainyl-CoA:carnitine CoA-transferase CaiB-like acyl-CoA transferase